MRLEDIKKVLEIGFKYYYCYTSLRILDNDIIEKETDDFNQDVENLYRIGKIFMEEEENE